MYKYRKISLYIFSLFYIVLFTMEVIKYLKMDSNVYGMIYLIVSLFFLFMLVPTVINYKDNYSMTRFSKLIILALIGIFNSFILNHIVFSNLNYMDSSYEFLGTIKYTRCFLKPVIYVFILILSLRECKLYLKIKELIKK